jgi:hypothetical protein
VGNRGTIAIARLKKVHAERLLAAYDANPVDALTDALRIALDMPGASWAQLVAAAPIDGERRRLLLDGDEHTLDTLAVELNERRGLS